MANKILRSKSEDLLLNLLIMHINRLQPLILQMP